MRIIVQKYGGASLAEPRQIQHIAKRIAQLHQKDWSAIVVVSAMGKTTDRLIGLAQEVCEIPARRELDMLLSTGERISMALLSMALQSLGVPAISFTGSQAGVMTDATHSNARITGIKPIRVEEELRRRRVVVLAGFQGVHPITKEITTLGRGGTDTTAVAMAACFRAERCEILKEVKGVYSADPNLVPEARLLAKIPGEPLRDMCWAGAQVLHYRCVELAHSLKVPLFIGPADEPKLGTQMINDPLQDSEKTLKENSDMFEACRVLGVNSHAEVFEVVWRGLDTTESLAAFERILEQQGLPWPQILGAAETKGERTFLYITAPNEQLFTIRHWLEKSPGQEISPEVRAGLSSVTATCIGSYSSPLISQMVKSLKKVDCPVEFILPSSSSVTFVVSKQCQTLAISTLHEFTSEV